MWFKRNLIVIFFVKVILENFGWGDDYECLFVCISIVFIKMLCEVLEISGELCKLKILLCWWSCFCL